MDSSNIIPILIIALVVALAVGPIMWFRTTPAQKRVIRFRRRAAERNLRVQVHAAAGLKLDSSVVAYGLPWVHEAGDAPSLLRHPDLQPWRLQRERIEHDGHFAGWWDWQPALEAPAAWRPALRELLPDLPPDAVLLENNRQGLWLYWRERGDIAQVDRIADQLQGLKALGRELGRRRVEAEEPEAGPDQDGSGEEI